MKRLGDLVDVLGGGTPSKERPDYWEGAIPWVSPKDMKVDEIRDAQDHIGEDALRESACKLIPANSVLFVVRGMILAHTLPVAITRVPVAINQDMKALVPRPGLLPEYLFWALRATSGKLLESCEVAGHGTRRLASEHWEALVMSLPPLDEQLRVVSTLKAVMNRVDEAERLAIESSIDTGVLEQQAIEELLLETRRSGEPMTIGSISRRIQYGSSAKAGFSGSVPVVRMGNLRHGRLDLTDLKHLDISPGDLSKYQLVPGDVLVNRTNSLELVGKAACVRDLTSPMIYASYLMRVKVDQTRADPGFVADSINSRLGRNYVASKARRAIGMVNINAKELAAMPVILPSLGVQTRCAEAIERTRQLMTRYRDEHDRAFGSLRSAILRRAFAGGL